MTKLDSMQLYRVYHHQTRLWISAMPKASSISLSPRQATPRVLGAEAKNINPIATAVIIATASAAIGYVVNFATERREVELTHINAQIEHLYGPLYSLSEANDRAWKAYSNEYWNERLQARRGYFNLNDSDPPTKEQISSWRAWMTNVFQPLNLQMEKIIIENAQLAQGGHVHPVFEQLVAHTEAYKVTIKSWENEKSLSPLRKDNTALIDFPTSTFGPCVRSVYFALVSA